jgi:DNA invertase Pin-like site-specific DNA recombinase
VLRKHGAGKVFREVASGAKTERAQLRRVLDQLDAGDVVMVMPLDRLARSTRDLLHTLATITGKEACFREAIRRRDRDGASVREIARSYNVSHSTISRLGDGP